MRENIPEMLFATRNDFRQWLSDNAESSLGIWLIFSKSKNILTVNANDALEEALCFGWIDGQIYSIDNEKYKKYFAPRRKNSVWSEKNKKTIEILRTKNIMTSLGELAVEEAKKNGKWESKIIELTNDQIDFFANKVKKYPQAYANFNKMSPSIRKTYARRYFSFKSEDTREKDFLKIIDRLNNNQLPM